MKRLMRAGVHQYVAEAISFANYPVDDQEVMRLFAPRIVGQPTWAPTASFLKAPDSQGLRDLMLLLFGKEPNEYMSSPADDSTAHPGPVELAPGPKSPPKSRLPSRDRGETLHAQGFLRFGGDRHPVGELNVEDELPADLAWCFFALAPVIDGLSRLAWVDQMLAADDIARASLRLERGLKPFDELHYEDMEALEDLAVDIDISQEPGGNYVADVEPFPDGRDVGLTARVALYVAFTQIETRRMQRTLVYSAARLVDEVGARTGSLNDYNRGLAARMVVVGHKKNIERNEDL